MKREIEDDLIQWKNNPRRMPLLLRGARQVGKTYILKKFGETEFDDCVLIDLEQQTEYAECFMTLDPQRIVARIEAISRRRVIPGKTLLILDEIQANPKALMAMRYFKEQMPELHVVGAGSLLEFVLNDESFRMPVGRVQYLFLKPLSFAEFLAASGNDRLLEEMRKVSAKKPLDMALHNHALGLLREYLALGGMPAVLAEYIQSHSIYASQQLQTALLNTYRDDFGKYARHSQHKHLQTLFDQSPAFISKWVKYSKLDPHTDPRTLRTALTQLTDAGLIYPIYASSATGLPLIASINRKKFKLLFLDVGLVQRSMRLDLSVLMKDDLLSVNRGAVIEQFVGQELLAATDRYQQAELYFWIREKAGSSAEIDYLTNIGAQIVPIEVKAGSTGRMRSLRLFMEEKATSLGVCISTNPLSLEKGILNVPLYLIDQLPRLVSEL